MFSLPLGLLGLISLPILGGIYLLRHRFRRRVVSSLILWQQSSKPRQGGRTLDRVNGSWLMALELGILALLALAMAGPRCSEDVSALRLVIILDDSWSMQAVERPSDQVDDASPVLTGRSTIDQARGWINEETARLRPRSVVVFKAGSRIERSEAMEQPSDLADFLESWAASSPETSLRPAIDQALEQFGTDSRLLVVTDRAPREGERPEGILWRAFGQPADNLAITHAARRRVENQDRISVEVANLGSEAVETRLQIRDIDRQTPAEDQELVLSPGEATRMRFTLPASTGTLLLSLPDDRLDLDNRVHLPPPQTIRSRVAVRLDDPQLGRLVADAVLATGQADLVADQQAADLIITSAQAADTAIGRLTWRVRIDSRDQEAQTYIGPFLLDRTHPLLEGVSLDGVLWRAPAISESGSPVGRLLTSGAPIIAAHTGSLVSVQDADLRQVEIAWRLNPAGSNLQATFNWPVMWSNLLRWRCNALPGLLVHEAGLGGEVGWFETFNTSSTIIKPDGQRSTPVSIQGRVSLRADQPGVYRIRHGDAPARLLGVNATDRRTSDLRQRESGTWGDPFDDEPVDEGSFPLVLPILMLALAGLMTHQWLLMRMRAAEVGW